MNTMKIGTETGSLMNHLYSREQGAPIGKGVDVTELMWTDRHAWRCVAEEKIGKQEVYTLRRYAAKCGNYYAQDYTYDDADGNPMLGDEEMKVCLYRGNWYRRFDDGKRGEKINLAWGRRDEHYDPCF